jgi:hypothetical protein
MKSVNLIPAPRRAARQRRACLRRCAVACAAWAVVSAAAAAGSHALWRDAEDAQAEDRYATVSEDIERTERAISTVRGQLAAAQSTLRAHEAIANQPDWSVLLAVLARRMGQEVVLKSVHVHPAGATAAARSDPRRTTVVQQSPSAAGGDSVPFVLEASGMARSHLAANRFVRALDETKLFARVFVLDTAREPFLNGTAIAFRLECSLDEPAGTGAGTVASSSAPGEAGTTGPRATGVAADGTQASLDKR